MSRKILAVLLAIVMIVVIIPTTAFAQTEETTEPTIIETSDKVMAKQEVDGCVVQYEYLKETEESYLSIANERYKLDVQMVDDVLLVSMSSEAENTYETKVVAQVTTATIAVGFCTVAVVYAAKDVIVAGLSKAVQASTSAIEIAADSIANTINKIRANKITTKNVTAASSAKRKVAVAAITKIKKAKKDNKDYYFSARLVNGTVYIGKQISYSQAVSRLRSGLDVFASGQQAAQKAAKAASPRKRAAPHGSHHSGDGNFPHFHATGVKWKNNPKHEPHCWYGQ